MSSIFTKIIQGEIPCHRIYEDDRFLAFLDIRPISRGHTLLIPKQEIDYVFDLPEDLLGELMTTARPIARAIEALVPCQRIGLMVAGLEVPHCHLHLVPMNDIQDLNFANAQPAEHDALSALAEQICQKLSANS